ncbi:MAG: lytic transglycosylase domain-containing protein [Deltaproteobacteria bacterium]|nr:lytic transglycosylase domain-containing protein [Deltaproteobacteria bacterium]
MINRVRKSTARGIVWSFCTLAVLALTTASAWASARTIEVPLRFDSVFLRQALEVQLYTTATKKAVLWDDGTGCGFLKLREPVVSTAGTRLRIVTRGEARVGTAIGEQCLAPVQWDGRIEILEEPVISEDQSALSFRVVESSLYNTDGKKPLLSGVIWDLVKRYAQPSFETVRIDLKAATSDLREILPLVLARDDRPRIERMIDSLRLTDANVTDQGVAVTIHLAVEPNNAPTPAAEPTLSPEELQHIDAALNHWDSFLTFVIKRLWADTLISDLRQPIADVLIEARYDILEALAPAESDKPDSVPALFVKTWQRLAPVARESASRQPGSTALRYVSFLSAGDALVALQQAGPDIGVDISADGLRRLVRIVAPAETSDPLQYDTAVDPSLRVLLGFGPPLPAPDLSGAPEDESWWHGLLRVRQAWAVGEGPPADALRHWVALPESLSSYLAAVRGVLDLATQATLESAQLEERHRNVYRNAVLATAWQESCWRQFILKSGQITYLKSSVGASGMMQVNERVWRGVYDLRGLRWDISYNGRAGAEILFRYMNDYAIAKKEEKASGSVDNLARAAYAIYNGGPAAMARYRKSSTRPSLKKIDQLFWTKYQEVSKGNFDVKSCYSGGE